MKICCVGGLGFLGSHLVDALVDAGHEVTVIDNESASSMESGDSKAQYVFYADASDIDQFPNQKYDYVFHCASPSGPARIEPGYALNPIIDLTRVGLEFSQHVGARFIKFSTSEVYGRNDVMLTETTPTQVTAFYDARAEYSIGFIAAECLCFTHPHPDVQVLRLFNVVGPRHSSKTGAVLPRMVEQAKAAQPITVVGDGQQLRVFMDVSDLISFCLLLMNNWPKEKGTWNVANPNNLVHMLGLAEFVWHEVHGPDSKPKIEFIDGKQLGRYYRDGVGKTAISIEKAASIGWLPKVGLREIIKRCL